MFHRGDHVVYGCHGVCTISDIESKHINKKNIDYYVLEPVEQPGSKFFVPTQNAAAVAKMQPLLTKAELEDILESGAVSEDVWINDENQRKQRYRELITSVDRVALLSMIHALYQHKAQQLAAGHKFHICDENFLRDAKKLLDGEISYVLGIPQAEVEAYILRTIVK